MSKTSTENKYKLKGLLGSLARAALCAIGPRAAPLGRAEPPAQADGLPVQRLHLLRTWAERWLCLPPVLLRSAFSTWATCLVLAGLGAPIWPARPRLAACGPGTPVSRNEACSTAPLARTRVRRPLHEPPPPERARRPSSAGRAPCAACSAARAPRVIVKLRCSFPYRRKLPETNEQRKRGDEQKDPKLQIQKKTHSN